MEPNQASITALFAAFMRAQHYAYDTPKLFADPLAAQLLSGDEQQRFEAVYVNILNDVYPTLAAACADHRSKVQRMSWESAAYAETLSRARYAEDKLAEAVKHGIDQYVVIGAGMDSFAFRRPEALKHVHVFEVDHPATQAVKQQRLAAAGFTPPANLHFVTADLAQERLAAALTQAPYRPDAPAFFSWLGVAMYLPRDAVFETLRGMRSVSAPGSQLVFDYLDTEVFVPDKVAPRVQRVMDWTRARGEPFLSGFDARTLAAELARIGFQLQENLNPHEIATRYFQGRADDLRACEHAYFACAVVE